MILQGNAILFCECNQRKMAREHNRFVNECYTLLLQCDTCTIHLGRNILLRGHTIVFLCNNTNRYLYHNQASIKTGTDHAQIFNVIICGKDGFLSCHKSDVLIHYET